MNYSVAWRDFQQVLLPRFQGLKEKSLATRLKYAWPKTWLKNTSNITSLKHDCLQVLGTLTIAMPQVIYITQKFQSTHLSRTKWLQIVHCQMKKNRKNLITTLSFFTTSHKYMNLNGAGSGERLFPVPPPLPQILPLVQVTQ